MLELRPYQLDTLDRSAAAEERGVRRQLWVLATGLGKTVCFTALIGRRGGRALIVAHRDELIAQAVAKLLESDDHYRITESAATALGSLGRHDLVAQALFADGPLVGIVKGKADDVAADVVVASIQTAARPTRLARLTGEGQLLTLAPFTTVVVDEAHHTPATTYRSMLAELDAGSPTGPLLVGVTATPDRGDGHGLDRDYDEVVAHYDTLWGIRNGYLCDVRAVEVTLAGFDVKSMRKTAGDYTAGSAGAALTAAHAPTMIVKAWTAYAAGRPTVVFTPTVAVATAVAESFRQAGIEAASVNGETPNDERKETLDRLRNGDLMVVSNCAVLTEGWDEPSVACVVQARPTTSRALYSQMVGRGLRRYPGKPDCLILDIVGNTSQHDLVTVPSLFGIADDPRSRDGSAPLARMVKEAERPPVPVGALVATEATLFRPMPDSNIVWLPSLNPKTGLDQWIRPLGRTKAGSGFRELPTVVLIRRSADTDEWVAGLVFTDGTKRVLIDRVTLAIAQGVGEDYVRKNAAHQAIVLANAQWRMNPPSNKQRAAAELHRVNIEPSWNAGQVADAIDNAKAHRRGISKGAVANVS